MPNPIDDDDELARALGRAVGHWSLVEMVVAMTFAVCLSADGHRSASVWKRFKGVGLQKEVILELAALNEKIDQADQEELSKLLISYCSLAQERNRFVHNPFGWKDGVSGSQIYQAYTEKRITRDKFYIKSQPISPDVIRSFAQKASQLTDEFSKWLFNIDKREFSKITNL